MSVKVEGIKELERKLKKLKIDVNKAKTEACRDGAKIVQQDVIRRISPYIVPPTVGPKAIRIEEIANQGGKTELMIGVDPDYMLYGKSETSLQWIEFGYPGYAPFPFLRTSFAKKKAEVINKIKENLSQKVNKT